MRFTTTEDQQRQPELETQKLNSSETRDLDPSDPIPRTESPLLVPPISPHSILQHHSEFPNIPSRLVVHFPTILSDSETETEPELKFPDHFLKHPHPRYEIDRENSSSIPISHGRVFLESLLLSSTKPITLAGSVLVQNLAYGKEVDIRFSVDGWRTTSEVGCHHVCTLTMTPLHESEIGGEWDRFTFNINMEDFRHGLENRTLLLAVKYEVPGVGRWWDNNDGKNYEIHFKKIEEPISHDANTTHLHRYATVPPPAPKTSEIRRASFSSGSSGGSPSALYRLPNYASPAAAPATTPHASTFRGRVSRRALSMGPIFAGHPVSRLDQPEVSQAEFDQFLMPPPAPKCGHCSEAQPGYTNYASPGDIARSASPSPKKRRFTIGPMIAGQPTTMHPALMDS